MRTFLLLLISLLYIFLAMFFWIRSTYPESLVYYAEPASVGMWPFQSIDTMKYSRDMARAKANDPAFDAVIETQVKNIAATGATSVAIATPYDEEFVPVLERWVKAARAQGLSVWFRGNFSGWERWFDYAPLSPEEHIAKTEKFILDHPDLFRDGDAFTSCPECENGVMGDPRQTGKVEEYRNFLISEYDLTNKVFKKIGKNVTTNYFSMNADVARLVMDRETTARLGGVVTLDHYVVTPEKLALDVHEMSQRSGGKIILGEFGVPIPDLQGDLTPQEQARWIEQALEALAKIPELSGVNYWLSVGGSTRLWEESGAARPAVETVSKFFHSRVFFGRVFDDLGRPLPQAKLTVGESESESNQDGYFVITVPQFVTDGTLKISKEGYRSGELRAKTGTGAEIVLVKEKKSFPEQVVAFWKLMLGEIRR